MICENIVSFCENKVHNPLFVKELLLLNQFYLQTIKILKTDISHKNSTY